MSRQRLVKTKGSYVATEFSGVVLRQGIFMSQQRLVKTIGSYVTTEFSGVVS